MIVRVDVTTMNNVKITMVGNQGSRKKPSQTTAIVNAPIKIVTLIAPKQSMKNPPSCIESRLKIPPMT